MIGHILPRWGSRTRKNSTSSRASHFPLQLKPGSISGHFPALTGICARPPLLDFTSRLARVVVARLAANAQNVTEQMVINHRLISIQGACLELLNDKTKCDASKR